MRLKLFFLCFHEAETFFLGLHEVHIFSSDEAQIIFSRVAWGSNYFFSDCMGLELFFLGFHEAHIFSSNSWHSNLFFLRLHEAQIIFSLDFMRIIFSLDFMRITFSFDFMRFKLFYFLISSDKQIFSSTPVMTRCGKLCPTKFFCHLCSPLIYEMRNYGNVNIQLCQRKKVFFWIFMLPQPAPK